MLKLRFSPMDPAAKLLSSLRSFERLDSHDQKLRRTWKAAVGQRIARHSRVIQLSGNSLIVAVDDPIWKRQLEQMHSQIRDRVKDVSGVQEVERIQFRVSPPRIQPQPEEKFTLSADEADRIADPLLRTIYKDSRRKAKA